MSSTAIVGVLLAPLVALASTPVAIRLAGRLQLYDVPSGWKNHRSPTPYLGGAAVTAAFLLALAVAGAEQQGVFALGGATALMWGVGTLDDYRGVHWLVRIGWEVAGGAILWAAGLGWSVLPWETANFVLTAIWIVGVVNAVNLLDLMDGVAGTVSAVCAAGAGVLGLLSSDELVAVAAFCLAGACLGFLPYNMGRPARIFLGDGGSMPIGFVLASLMMAVGDDTGVGWVTVLAAGVVLGLPLLDMGYRVTSRVRRRAGLLQAGHDSLANYLERSFGNPQRVAASLGGVQALLCLVGIGALELGQGSVVAAWTIWFVVGTTTISLLETRVWGPTVPSSRETASIGRSGRQPHQVWLSPTEIVVVAFVVISCGLSPFLYGFYDVSVWGPIALGMLAALLGLLIARPAAPRRAALVAAGALAVIWIWAVLSTGWAESADQAMTDANRWMLYAALFGVLILLLRSDRLGTVVVGAGAAAIAAFGVYLLARMILGSAEDLFLVGRLHEPLGYINGQAGYLLIGVWPLVALAERSRSRLAGAVGVAGASALLGLVLLGQTRAVLPALLVSIVVLLLVVPGRTRRAWALAAVACGIVVALAPVLEVYDSVGPGAPQPSETVTREAGLAIALGAVVAGALWAAVSALAPVVSGRLGAGRARTIAWAPLAVAALLAVVVALSAVDDPAGRVADEYRSFVELDRDAASSSRFTTGAGNRYDYWRVAWTQFREDPLRGVGAGNYDRTYFLERRTAEDIRQPHSIELQALAELGIVGAVALALFLAAIVFGFARRVGAARTNLGDRGLAVAAGGGFIVWLVHTSVDWLHLIPGVTGLALASAAALVGPWRRPAGERVTTRRVVVVAAAVVIVFGAVLVGRSALADNYRSDAQNLLGTAPAKAIAKAQDSLALDDEALETYYVEAAAYARVDDYAGARAALVEATRREPHDFVTWGLLGDLAVRRGEMAQARRAYREAARLNPRNRELAALAKDPASALDR